MNKDMNKKYLKKLAKAQLIRLLLKQKKIDKLKNQAIALSRCMIKLFRGGRGGGWGGGSSERCLKWGGGGGGY